jgi:hypothetical protein
MSHPMKSPKLFAVFPALLAVLVPLKADTLWNVQFSTNIVLSACGAGDPVSLNSQNVSVDESGNFNTVWSSSTPVLRVQGHVSASTFTATLTCLNGGASGSLSATSATNGGNFAGTFTFDCPGQECSQGTIRVYRDEIRCDDVSLPQPQGLAADFEAASDPTTCRGLVDMTRLTAEMHAAIVNFRALVLARRPRATFTITSAFRPPEFQAHLHEIKMEFEELDHLQGVNSVKRLRRPQLIISGGAALSPVCRRRIDAVNEEIRKHCLKPSRNPPYTPPVNPAGVSYHEIGRAVDIEIPRMPRSLIDQLAAQAGLHRPCKRDDDVHFQLLSDPTCARPAQGL